jgi:DNA-binding PadR family transcriptional regulator
MPLEVSILEAAASLRGQGTREFYGFVLAKEMKRLNGARQRTAYGTLYRTLDRMTRVGWLSSRWEDPSIAAAEGRPRRRFYEVTALGEQALAGTREARVAGLATQAGF